jgi:hypothetical protein
MMKRSQTKLLKSGAVQIKAAARSGPLVGTNAANSGQDITCLAVDEYPDDKPLHKQKPKYGNIHLGSSSLKARDSNKFAVKQSHLS